MVSLFHFAPELYDVGTWLESFPGLSLAMAAFHLLFDTIFSRSLSIIDMEMDYIEGFSISCSDSAMYHKAYESGSWQSNWESLSGIFTSAPQLRRGAVSGLNFLASGPTMLSITNSGLALGQKPGRHLVGEVDGMSMN